MWIKFWRLTLVKGSGRNNHWKRMVECECDCWNIKEYVLSRLKLWVTKSCWCLRKEQLAERNKLNIKPWKTYGRLTIIKEAEAYLQPNGQLKRVFSCGCVCWNTTAVRLSDLESWATQSCGCLHKERAAEWKTTHWQSYTRMYSIWSNMKSRCYDKASPDYPRYWGRGIAVNNRRKKFEYFYEDMHVLYQKHLAKHWEVDTTIDRIDNNWNYVRSNCRRATQKTQANNKMNNRMIYHKWETLNITQRAEKLWTTVPTIYSKMYDYDTTYEDALSEIDK